MKFWAGVAAWGTASLVAGAISIVSLYVAGYHGRCIYARHLNRRG